MLLAPQLETQLQSPLQGGANQNQRGIGRHFAVVTRHDQAPHQNSQAAGDIEQPTPKPLDLSLAPELERAPKRDPQGKYHGRQAKIHQMPKYVIPSHSFPSLLVQVL